MTDIFKKKMNVLYICAKEIPEGNSQSVFHAEFISYKQYNQRALNSLANYKALLFWDEEIINP